MLPEAKRAVKTAKTPSDLDMPIRHMIIEVVKCLWPNFKCLWPNRMFVLKQKGDSGQGFDLSSEVL